MTTSRQRPSDAEVEAWVAQVRPHVTAHAASRRWWRRLSRPTVALGVVAMVAAGGIAYATVSDVTRTAEAPETIRGDSAIEIGLPAPGDRWLTISVTYRCGRGGRFAVRDDTHELLSGGCPEDGVVGGHQGVSTSVPADEVDGTRLTVTSDDIRGYQADAFWVQAPPPVSPEEALRKARERWARGFGATPVIVSPFEHLFDNDDDVG